MIIDTWKRGECVDDYRTLLIENPGLGSIDLILAHDQPPVLRPPLKLVRPRVTISPEATSPEGVPAHGLPAHSITRVIRKTSPKP